MPNSKLWPNISAMNYGNFLHMQLCPGLGGWGGGEGDGQSVGGGVCEDRIGGSEDVRGWEE